MSWETDRQKNERIQRQQRSNMIYTRDVKGTGKESTVGEYMTAAAKQLDTKAPIKIKGFRISPTGVSLLFIEDEQAKKPERRVADCMR